MLRCATPVSYFDWHEQPGYWADVTRHFASDSELLDIGCGTGWLAEHFPATPASTAPPDAVEIASGLNSAT